MSKMLDKIISRILLVVLVVTSYSCKPTDDGAVLITPSPVATTLSQGYYTISSQTVFSVENAEQERIASLFCNLIEKASGINIRLTKNNSAAAIRFISDDQVDREGAYTIHVTSSGIEIKAST